MPKLIKLHGANADFANDAFVVATEEEGVPTSGGVILPLAHRLYDEAGAVVEEREYAGPEQLPSRVEGGTVTEIAYLSLCS